MGHLVGVVIQLFKGVKNNTQVMNRESLLVFLKGSKADKEALKCNNPTLFEYFRMSAVDTRLKDYHLSIVLCSFVAIKQTALILFAIKALRHLSTYGTVVGLEVIIRCARVTMCSR